MATEAFIINEKENKAYLQIDRTRRHGGIRLQSNSLNSIGISVDGCTYFRDFYLGNLLYSLNLTNAVFTIEVNKNCDKTTNNSILKDKIDDVLIITIKNNRVVDIKNEKDEVIYKNGYIYIENFEAGWLGKVFDYYTGILSADIKDYNENGRRTVWGIIHTD